MCLFSKVCSSLHLLCFSLVALQAEAQCPWEPYSNFVQNPGLVSNILRHNHKNSRKPLDTVSWPERQPEFPSDVVGGDVSRTLPSGLRPISQPAEISCSGNPQLDLIVWTVSQQYIWARSSTCGPSVHFWEKSLHAYMDHRSDPFHLIYIYIIEVRDSRAGDFSPA